MTGFGGTEADSSSVAAASESRVGGFILFKSNIASASAVSSLNASLSCAQPIEPWISVDQEPGEVARLTGILPSQPTPTDLGAEFERGQITAADVERLGKEQGDGLKGLNFSMDLAPVVDVARDNADEVISGRSFGSDPSVVATLSVAYTRGLQEGGVAAVAKHFPGIGDIHSDPHTNLPTIDLGRDIWQRVDRAPFAAVIGAKTTGVMVTDVIMAAIDGQNARQSSKVIDGALRDGLGFHGLVLTDALEMGGPNARSETASAAVASVEAGADMVLITDPTEDAPVIDALEEAVQSGQITEQQLDASLRRVLAAKEHTLGATALSAQRCAGRTATHS
jgi:beta-N-acetylhexosaminidase